MDTYYRDFFLVYNFCEIFYMSLRIDGLFDFSTNDWVQSEGPTLSSIEDVCPATVTYVLLATMRPCLHFISECSRIEGIQDSDFVLER